MSGQKIVRLKIRRQNAPDQPAFWEEFAVDYSPKMNIISCLMEIQKDPVNAQGQKTNPVVWECNCLEEVCGACTMNINGQARQACSALVDQLEQPIVLEPLRKFPILRDLMVDRTIMFENLKRVHAWIDIDGTYDLGPGPRMAEVDRVWAYELSKCMTCGCCMESCPQVNSRSRFIGPAAVSQARLFNTHPSGAMHKHIRLSALMGDGGITDCGNAQNCVRACPKEIPLTTSLADMNKEVNKFALKRWFNT